MNKKIEVRIVDSFDIEHIQKYASVYNTLVRHEHLEYDLTIVYNKSGKVVIHKVDVYNNITMIAIMNVIYEVVIKNATPNSDFLKHGFSQADMLKINEICKYTRRNKYPQYNSVILSNDDYTSVTPIFKPAKNDLLTLKTIQDMMAQRPQTPNMTYIDYPTQLPTTEVKNKLQEEQLKIADKYFGDNIKNQLKYNHW